MKDVVDPQLQDQQAGFRKDRSCTDKIATLLIILEQSLKWNSSLYVSFIDFEKAFNSIDRASLWRLLRLYRVPEKITNIIRNSYEGLTCKVVHSGQLTDAFLWMLWNQLEDFDFADDLALPSHTQQQMQEKSSIVAENSTHLGLNFHKGKSKVLNINTINTAPIVLE
ncbi:hypothetical protein M9458_052208, partial [Cirrhinus mrigala]